jgi:hypothetical protein
MTTIPKFEIKPYPYPSGANAFGRKQVLVDGVRWATIVPKSHGPNGQTYTFEDAGGKLVRRDPDPKIARSRTAWGDEKLGYPFTVYSDRFEQRGWKLGQLTTLDQRLKAEITTMLKLGKLRDPAVIAAATQKHIESRERRLKEMVNEQKREFRKHARAQIGDLVGDNVIEQVLDKMVEAMEWAQTR